MLCRAVLTNLRTLAMVVRTRAQGIGAKAREGGESWEVCYGMRETTRAHTYGVRFSRAAADRSFPQTPLLPPLAELACFDSPHTTPGAP